MANFYSWSQLENGNAYSYALRSDKTLFAWGNNAAGQLGDGTTINKSSPIQVPGSWNSIATGTTHVAAIASDNTLWMWGLNSLGQLGLSDTINRSSPVQVAGSWSTISSGLNYTLATNTTNLLWGWGLNASYQLGLNGGDTINRSSPTQIGTSNWTMVSAGVSHVLAIDYSNKLYGWGTGSFGQGVNPARTSYIQVGGTSNNSTFALRSDGTLFLWGTFTNILTSVTGKSSPAQLGTLSWASASTTGSNIYLIQSDGKLWGAGINGSGQLGVGDTISRSSLIQIDAGNSYITVSGGNLHVMAIKSDYTLWAWGFGTTGQLGIGSVITRSSPVQITSASYSSWLVISAGNALSAGITTNGSLWVWGNGANGQLGNGGTLSRSAPTQIGGSSFTSVSVGDQYISVIKADSTLWTWGLGTFGQLGQGDTLSRSSPIQIGTSSFTLVSSGNTASSGSTAIGVDGTLWGWGLNNAGQLAQGDTINRSSPVQIGTSSWTIVSLTGTGTVIGLTKDNLLWAWGYNISGTIGDGTLTSRSSPVQIGTKIDLVVISPTQIGTSSWTSVAAGYSHSLAIRSDGKLFSWGDNSYGQLGAGLSISSVVAGGSNTAVIRSDGTLWTWGWGPLGDGTVLSRSSPVQVTGGKFWKKVFVANSSMYGIDSNNLLFVWGFNNTGQLGDSTTVTKSNPIQIGNSSWVQVAAPVMTNAGPVNSNHQIAVYAIRSDGALFVWGFNNTGQLGLGDMVNRSSPVQVGTSSWTQVVAGDGYFIGLTTDGTLYGAGQTINATLGTPLLWSKILTGEGTTYAIRNDGKLFAWGINNAGQLGDGTVIDKSSPIQIGTSNWLAVSAGTSYVAAIKSDNTLWNWGINTYGQLGLTTDTVARSSPTQVGNSSWSIVNCGGAIGRAPMGPNMIGITTDGKLFAWGYGVEGQVIDPSTGATTNRSSPVQIGASSWTTVSSGFGNLSAIRLDGALFTWGDNTYGQLGLTNINATGDTISRSSPVQVGTSSWTAVVSGLGHTIALRNDKTLWGWGRNTVGQIGNTATINRSSPVQVGTSSWVAISVGASYSVALRLDNSAWAWGLNASGSLGDGTTVNKSTPTAIGATLYQQINAGIATTVTVPISSAYGAGTTGYAGYIWGSNSFGQYGDGTTINRSSPVQVSTFPLSYSTPTQVQSGSWTSIASTGSHVLAVDTTNKLYGWGINSSGQLGLGDTINRSSSTQISTSSWTQIVAGGTHTVALRTDGTLWTWGLAGSGQLGTGDTLARSSPVQIGTNISSWTQIAASDASSYGIFNGVLYVWGLNSIGQLGTNNITATTNYLTSALSIVLAAMSSPTQIGISSWSFVSAGNNYSIGLSNTNKLFVWGINTSGLLGDTASIVSRSTPIQLGGNTSYSQVSTGGTHTTFTSTTSPQTITAAGLNSSGQLGDGTTIARSSLTQVLTSAIDHKSSPVQIAALGVYTSYYVSSPTQLGTSSWSQVSAGTTHTAAITTLGSLFAWGLNSSGQLGNSNTTSRSSPIQLNSSSYSLVSAGADYTTVLNYTDKTLWAFGNQSLGQLGDNTTITNTSYGSPTTSVTVSYLVAGGGGTSSTTSGGGGGAGGLVLGTLTLNNNTVYSITVGAGARQRSTSIIPMGVDPTGQSSSLSGSGFSSIIALGGGSSMGGISSAFTAYYASAGGSGAGQANTATIVIATGGSALQPTSASGGYGNAGGAVAALTLPGGGGGGGAGTAGSLGAGGAGLASSITGTSTYYCAGANGYLTSGISAFGGSNPGSGNQLTNGPATLTGDLGFGFDGAVILRFPYTTNTAVVTGNPTITVDAGYFVYQWLTAGTYSIVFK